MPEGTKSWTESQLDYLAAQLAEAKSKLAETEAYRVAEVKLRESAEAEALSYKAELVRPLHEEEIPYLTQIKELQERISGYIDVNIESLKRAEIAEQCLATEKRVAEELEARAEAAEAELQKLRAGADEPVEGVVDALANLNERMEAAEARLTRILVAARHIHKEPPPRG